MALLRARILLVVAAAVLLVGGGAFAWMAMGWHGEFGTWNPLVVRDLRAFHRDALAPTMAALNGDTGGGMAAVSAPAAQRFEDAQLRALQGRVAAHDRALDEWRRRPVTGRFAAHWAEFGRELEAGRAFYAARVEIVRRFGVDYPPESEPACRYHAGWLTYLEHIQRSLAAWEAATGIKAADNVASLVAGARADRDRACA